MMVVARGSLYCLQGHWDLLAPGNKDSYHFVSAKIPVAKKHVTISSLLLHFSPSSKLVPVVTSSC